MKVAAAFKSPDSACTTAESKKLRAMQPLDKPDRPQIKSSEKYQKREEADIIGDVGTDEGAGLGRFQDCLGSDYHYSRLD